MATKLPQSDTLVNYCWLCRKYHGYETWCAFNLAKVAGKGLVIGIAAIAAAYGWFAEWSVKLLLLAVIGAFVYMAFATVLGWELDPVTPLLHSIRG
jgi:hypothetical protein